MEKAYKLLCYEEIDSTNSEAKRLIEQGEYEGDTPLVIVARSQSLGRGRHGKSFCSPAGTGVYMSIVIAPGCPISGQVTITTRVAVAVARAIERCTGTAPGIKWVNDLFLNGKKVCGILCEAVNDYEKGTLDKVIIGVGVNVGYSEMPGELKDIAGSILSEESTREEVEELRDRLTQAIADSVISELDCMLTGKESGYLSYYRAHSTVIGKDIYFFMDGERTLAHAADIDSEGGLIVTVLEGAEKGTEKVLNSGEISLRTILR